MREYALFIVLILCLTAPAFADVALPAIFSDGMVLQRGETVPVWGTAGDGERVRVEFRGAKAETAAKDGKWRVDIAPGEPGGPFEMTLRGANTITIKFVYVGDVWVCAGQSNMHMTRNFAPMKDAHDAIRLFTGVAEYKAIEKHGVWTTSGAFSSVGQHFPIGLLYAARGGTRIFMWTAEKVVPNPSPRPSKGKKQKAPYNMCYRTRVQPLQPYRIKGVIWWQGESDSSQSFARYTYHMHFPRMIEGLRKGWGQGDFPFLWVQLSSIKKRDCIGEIRDGMRRALTLPNTGMAVTFDLTNNDIVPCKRPGNLHPSYCYEEAAARLAGAARAVAYGEKIVWSGPLLEKGELGDGKIVLSFTQVGDGLVVKEGKGEGLYRFEVQEKVPAETLPGDEGEFKPVIASLGPEKKTVVLDVKGLTAPFRVRYAYGDIPRGNLYNSEDLPASPFVSDPIK